MITDFKYLTPLHLYRHPSALLNSKGKDPDYIVEWDYTVSFRLSGMRPGYENMQITIPGGENMQITVPSGLMTDLASVPRLARIFMGRVGRHLEAAIVHDYMYGETNWWTRKVADQIFLAGMETAGVKKWRREAAYRAVRLFGRKSFTLTNEYAPKEEIIHGGNR